VGQIIKKFPVSLETRRFRNIFTRSRHSTLSCISLHPSNLLLGDLLYSQFCYYAYYVDAHCLQQYSCRDKRCLYNANFKISALALTRFQQPVRKYPTSLFDGQSCSNLTLFRRFSLKWGLTKTQLTFFIPKVTVTLSSHLRLGLQSDSFFTFVRISHLFPSVLSQSLQSLCCGLH
jgi:hypothetical protein